MKRSGLLGVLVLLMLFTGGGHADIYRWTDAKGTIHFTNEPPPPGGVLVERIEEVPYDAEADRRRLEEDQRLRLERQKLELEERKAALDQREREARLKLEEANRTLERAQEQAAQAEQESGRDCSEEYFTRYGSCYGYPVIHYRQHRPRGGSDLYKGYTRQDGNLYYQERPKKPITAPPAPPKAPHDPDQPKPKPSKPPGKEGKPGAVPEASRPKAASAAPPADQP